MAEHAREAFAALGIRTCEEAARHFLGANSSNEGVTVTACALPKPSGVTPIFFKQYNHSRPSWRFVARSSKARQEARNYAVLRRLGLTVPELVCWGEERDMLGRLRKAIIATVAVPQSCTLPEYLASGDGKDAASRRKLLRELAHQVRALHAASFYHHDLVGRNLLVSRVANGPQLWWIDCPRGAYDRWSPVRPRKLLRDLAGLDKTGVQFCSEAERLHWFLEYLGATRLTDEHKRLAREVTRYRLEH